MQIKNKRGMELAVSTVILLVIGIIVLIGIISILIMGWDDFKTAIGAALGGDLSKAKRNCAIACAAENKETYCAANAEYPPNCYGNTTLKPADCELTCP